LVTDPAGDTADRVVVRVETEGGFAYVPGLARPVTVDSASLAPEEGARLRALLDDAAFWSRPAEGSPAEGGAGAPGRGAADLRTYTITASRGGESRVLRVSDPVDDPALRRLVDHVRGMRAGP
jgi:hypothetical protein